MCRRFGGELDDIAVGISEINRMNHAVVGDAAGFDAALFTFGEHGVKGWHIDFKSDVQVEIDLSQ